MEKVKVTQEQADLIKSIKDTDYAINIHGLNKRPDSPLQELTTAELARALYVGYEVEPEFKVGDWVVCEDDNIGEIEFINEFDGWANIGWSKVTTETGICLADTYNLTEIKRHATPEEIAEEKERRWWTKHGRDVWELKEGDVIKESYNQVIREVSYIKNNIVYVKCGGGFAIDATKVICFAEDRKDA